MNPTSFHLIWLLLVSLLPVKMLFSLQLQWADPPIIDEMRWVRGRAKELAEKISVSNDCRRVAAVFSEATPPFWALEVQWELLTRTNVSPVHGSVIDSDLVDEDTCFVFDNKNQAERVGAGYSFISQRYFFFD